jgi:hypothetical protein
MALARPAGKGLAGTTRKKTGHAAWLAKYFAYLL